MVLVLLGGCGAYIPRVTPELVLVAQRREPAANQESLEHGRAVFVARCSSCHSLPDPLDYSAGEWPRWMEKMGRKAKLSPASRNEALLYVLTVREVPPPR